MFKKPKKGGTGRFKHPLRVPGMRPGERCFICKSTDHVAKACPEKALWDKNKVRTYYGHLEIDAPYLDLVRLVLFSEELIDKDAMDAEWCSIVPDLGCGFKATVIFFWHCWVEPSKFKTEQVMVTFLKVSLSFVAWLDDVDWWDFQ